MLYPRSRETLSCPVVAPLRSLTVGVSRHSQLLCAFPAFLVPIQEGFTTSYDAVAVLEEEHPTPRVRNVIGKDESSVLLPQDEATYEILNVIASDGLPTLKIVKLEPQAQATKGVVMGYPFRMPVSLLQRHPQVEEAIRCITARTQEKTRQVIVTIRGSLPHQIDLGNWRV